MYSTSKSYNVLVNEKFSILAYKYRYRLITKLLHSYAKLNRKSLVKAMTVYMFYLAYITDFEVWIIKYQTEHTNTINEYRNRRICMATTVNNAFLEFMKNSVNLDSEKTKTARISRDNLINNIKGFDGCDEFFQIYDDRNLRFGSFERKTKIRPIDDIDLMICLSAEGRRTYFESNNTIYINTSDTEADKSLITLGTSQINSTKVINRFINKMSELSDYSKSEMHKNQEAATLKLKSYTWNFDIVPCFYTTADFYLIPDGAGNWKKTDPRIDNERTTSINKKYNGKLLELIRLIKYWNNRKVTIRIGSYLLECMILNRYENKSSNEHWWIDLEFRDTMNYLSSTILSDVNDPKGIQGNINNFDSEDRKKISDALFTAYKRAQEAVEFEANDYNQKKSITKWREIFGSEFPKYTE